MIELSVALPPWKAWRWWLFCKTSVVEWLRGWEGVDWVLICDARHPG